MHPPLCVCVLASLSVCLCAYCSGCHSVSLSCPSARPSGCVAAAHASWRNLPLMSSAVVTHLFKRPADLSVGVSASVSAMAHLRRPGHSDRPGISREPGGGGGKCCRMYCRCHCPFRPCASDPCTVMNSKWLGGWALVTKTTENRHLSAGQIQLRTNNVLK